MPPKEVNGVPLDHILHPFDDDEAGVERIAHRKVPTPQLEIGEPDPAWFTHFETFRSRIEAAFHAAHKSTGLDTPTVIAINHIGSTSVPSLPAKAVIDIDLILSSLTNEPSYVPALESAGFQFLLREPKWHGHRFFVGVEPMSCNLHVWGPKCAEVERHRIMKEWLISNREDRELYAQTKRDCARLCRENGEMVQRYNYRKQEVVRGILGRAFESLGYID
jgi:GrpB-like predicted nucleotidyltransferase (UPF0157 family)